MSATKIFLSVQINNNEKIKTDKVENQRKKNYPIKNYYKKFS